MIKAERFFIKKNEETDHLRSQGLLSKWNWQGNLTTNTFNSDENDTRPKEMLTTSTTNAVPEKGMKHPKFSSSNFLLQCETDNNNVSRNRSPLLNSLYLGHKRRFQNLGTLTMICMVLLLITRVYSQEDSTTPQDAFGGRYSKPNNAMSAKELHDLLSDGTGKVSHKFHHHIYYYCSVMAIFIYAH